jgi:hypothetical protein
LANTQQQTKHRIQLIFRRFTLHIKGKPPTIAKAGEVVLEQPGMEATATNASATGVTKVVIFYASQPKTPFLVPIAAQ